MIGAEPRVLSMDAAWLSTVHSGLRAVSAKADWCNAGQQQGQKQ